MERLPDAAAVRPAGNESGNELQFGFDEVQQFAAALLVVATAITLVTAALSWFVVERPVLAHKDRPPWARAGARMPEGAPR